MQLTAVIISVGLVLSTTVNAWTQDADGKWIANKEVVRVVVGEVRGEEVDKEVDQACTEREDPNTYRSSGDCEYWSDGSGGIVKGSK